MKNHKQDVGIEDGPTEKRRSSASVDEIRDLYSALQGLVPSASGSSVDVSETPGTSNLNSDNTSQSSKEQLFTRYSDPIPSKATPTPGIVEGRRSRSHSLDATPFSRSHSLDATPFFNSKRVIMKQDSIDVYRSKRTLTKSKESIEQLFTVVKDFDETEINYTRGRSHSLSVLLEATSAEATEDHEICETDGKELSSSADFNYIQNTFNPEICGESIAENAHQIAEKDSMDCLSGLQNDVKIDFPNKKRLSAGDILERQRARFCDPRTPYRRRSIGGSLLLSAIVSSTSTSPKRKGSLASALTLIAHKNKLQEFLKNFHKNECSGQQQNEETDQRNTNTQKSTETESKDILQDEMKTLLEAIEELQHDSTNSSVPTQSASLDTLDDARRPSVGTEMQNLLSAIRELILAGETSATSTPSCSRPNSRRPSLADSCPDGRKAESLEELEAYFKTKLENISESHKTDKSSPGILLSKSKKGTRVTRSNNRENIGARNNRRSSASQVEGKLPLQQPTIPKSNSVVDFLEFSNAIEFQRQRSDQEMKGYRTRTRSQSAHDIRLPEIRINNKSTNSSSRSRGKQAGILRSMSADTQTERALWKEDQLMFADQVNKRLQDWLEKATSLSLQENEQTKEDQGLGSNLSAVATSCSSDNEVEHKTKKSRFAMRKVLRKKIKRSKSIHNLSEPEQEKQSKSPLFRPAERNKVERSKSLHNLLDEEESQPKQKTNMFRSPQSLLRFGRQRLMRSKSVRNDIEKPKLSTTNSQVTESDESFDDDKSIVKTMQDSYDHIKASPETGNNGSATETVCSKSSPFLKRFALVKAGEKTTSHCKRLSKLPVNLPLFYIPGIDVPRLKTTKDDRHLSRSDPVVATQVHTDKKNLMIGDSEMKHGVFYDDASTQTASLFTISRNSSSGTDEGYIRSPSQEGFDDDSPNTSPDFNDFRDRTKSTASVDSGCPI